jgi:hypothetical protein
MPFATSGQVRGVGQMHVLCAKAGLLTPASALDINYKTPHIYFLS